MFRNWMRGLWRQSDRDKRRSSASPRRFRPCCEQLGSRVVPAVTASFSAATGVLLVVGDSLDNNIEISRDSGGNLLVNDGAIVIRGGPATATNTSLIQVLGQSGNDVIALDETNGSLPAAHLLGGSGNDTLTGGSGNDTFDGMSGDDVIHGLGGDDILRAGDGADVLNGGVGNDQLFGQGGPDQCIGGPGNDQLFGQSGNDLFVWNPGDGDDFIDGGSDQDSLQVNGDPVANDLIEIVPNGERVFVNRIAPSPFSLDVGATEAININTLGGDDIVNALPGISPIVHLTLDGGEGNDVLTGAEGDDVLLGGPGDDNLSGGRGNDLVNGGDGNDTLAGNAGIDAVFGELGDDVMVWNTGDGNDIMEGGEGNDIARIFGADDADDIFAVNAAGSLVRVDSGDPVAESVHIGTSESMEVNLQGGDDALTINDLPGIPFLTAINADGGAGSDVIDASAQLNPAISLFAVGGEGDDLLFGTASDDLLSGGIGDDVIFANAGDDVILGGEGGDVIDGNGGDDVMNGNGGEDVMSGGPGADIMAGDDGDDILTGEDGDDMLDGGLGDDILDGGPGDDVALNGELVFNVP